MDKDGIPLEGQPPVPDGDTLLAILQKRPQECSDSEKRAFFLLVNLALPILNSSFANKTHRDLLWQKFTASDITWCLYSFHCRSAPDVPLIEIEATSSVVSEMSTESSERTPKGNKSHRENKRRKVCTGKDRKDSVAYYFATKEKVEDFMGSEEGRVIVAAWGDEINRKDREERTQNRENVRPTQEGVVEKGGPKFRKSCGLDFLFPCNTVAV